MANNPERVQTMAKYARRSVASLFLLVGTATTIVSVVDSNKDDSFNQAHQQMRDSIDELSKLNGVYLHCVTMGTGFMGGPICGYEVTGRPSAEERTRKINAYSIKVRQREEAIFTRINGEDMERHIRNSVTFLAGVLSAAVGLGEVLRLSKGGMFNR